MLNGPERQENQSAARRSAVGETPRAKDAARCVERPRPPAARIVFVVAALLYMISPARAQQSSDAAPSGNAQKGKTLFMSDGCYECHGRQGQGATQTGAARIGPPMLSFEGFQSYVRAPRNQMPPYTSKALPEQDLADIYAYLRSIPMPPKGKDIPLLNK